MARILFVEPELRTDKLAPLYLSAILTHAGHTVDLVQDTGRYEAARYLREHTADFVMYSVTTGNHQWYLKKNRQLKERFEFVSVMGGPHLTYFPEDAINDPAVDYVVQGPGEDAIFDLCEWNVMPSINKLIRGQVPGDINRLPHPDRRILYKYPKFGKSRMKRFIACRDCPNACAYCFNHLYHRMFKDQRGRFYQTTTPRRMVDEILEVQERWGLELAYFNDDDFARDHEWLTEFCDLFKREAGIQFCGSVRASSLTDDVVRMMADAGCTFMNVALESAVPETQKLLRRGRVTNDDVWNACHWFRKHKIKVRLQNMVGLPVADPLEDALETLKFNVMVTPTDSWAAIFQPFQRTDLWKLCVKRGLVDKRADALTFFDDTILNFPEPTRERINRLARWWYFACKWRLDIDVVRELIDIPLAQEQKALIQSARWKQAAHILYEL